MVCARCAASSVLNFAPFEVMNPAVIPRSFCSSCTRLPVDTASTDSWCVRFISRTDVTFSLTLIHEKTNSPRIGGRIISSSLLRMVRFGMEPPVPRRRRSSALRRCDHSGSGVARLQ